MDFNAEKTNDGLLLYSKNGINDKWTYIGIMSRSDVMNLVKVLDIDFK